MLKSDALAAVDPRASTAVCELHKTHKPSPLYTEVHHVVPRAWQRFWQPTAAPYPGHYDGAELWDSRTVTICRTGHGNTHVWIVRYTREWERMLMEGADAPTVSQVIRATHKTSMSHEAQVASFALQRFIDAGGSVDGLVRAGLWGGI